MRIVSIRLVAVLIPLISMHFSYAKEVKRFSGEVLDHAGSQDTLRLIQENTPAAKLLRKNINRWCRNASEADVVLKFQCKKGQSAAPSFQDAVRNLTGSQGTLVKAYENFALSLPDSLKEEVLNECPKANDYLKCIEKIASKDKAASNAFYVWENEEIKLSVYRLYCDRVLGNVSIGQKYEFNRSGSNPECNRQPKLKELISPELAYRASDQKLAGSPQVSDVVGNTFDEQFGNCPAFIPQEFCGGGKYDPQYYRRGTKTISVLTSPDIRQKSSYKVVEQTIPSGFVYQPTPNVDFGGLGLDQVLSGVYEAVKPDFEKDLTNFVSELYVEKYLQFAAFSKAVDEGGGSLFDRRVKEIADAASCIPGGKKKAQDLAELIRQFGKRDKAQEMYRENLAKAGQCFKAAENRWQKLRTELAMDVDVAGPVLTEKEVEKLSFRQRLVVNTITTMPVIRQLLREMPVVKGLTKSTKYNCDNLRLRLDPTIDKKTKLAAKKEVQSWPQSRSTYCTNVYKEYLALTEEMNNLAMSYPVLITKTGKEPGYEKIVSASGINPKIKNYNRSLSKENELVGNDGSIYTVEVPIYNEDKPYCMQQLEGENSKKAKDAVNQILTENLTKHLSVAKDELKKLCDEKQREDVLSTALKSPEIMALYFSCKRPRFPMLASYLEIPPEKWLKAVPKEECHNKKNSGWVACAAHNAALDKEVNKQLGAQMMMAGFDTLFFLAPGIGGLPKSVSQAFVSMTMGGAIGAGLGYGIAHVTANPHELRSQASSQVAAFYAGVAPRESFEQAYHAIKRLNEIDPRVEAALTGAFAGGVFGLLAGGKGHADAADLAMSSKEAALFKQAELAKAYKILKEKGEFDSQTGKEAEAQLLAFFDDAIQSKNPEGITPELLAQLTLDEKLAMLEHPGAWPFPVSNVVPRNPETVLANLKPGQKIRYTNSKGQVLEGQVLKYDSKTGELIFASEKNGKLYTHRYSVEDLLSGDTFEILHPLKGKGFIMPERVGSVEKINLKTPLDTNSPLFKAIAARLRKDHGIRVIKDDFVIKKLNRNLRKSLGEGAELNGTTHALFVRKGFSLGDDIYIDEWATLEDLLGAYKDFKETKASLGAWEGAWEEGAWSQQRLTVRQVLQNFKKGDPLRDKLYDTALALDRLKSWLYEKDAALALGDEVYAKQAGTEADTFIHSIKSQIESLDGNVEPYKSILRKDYENLLDLKLKMDARAAKHQLRNKQRVLEARQSKPFALDVPPDTLVRFEKEFPDVFTYFTGEKQEAAKIIRILRNRDGKSPEEIKAFFGEAKLACRIP